MAPLRASRFLVGLLMSAGACAPEEHAAQSASIVVESGTWTRWNGTVPAPVLQTTSAVFDEQRQRLMAGSYSGMWEWDGNLWTQVSTVPSDGKMFYDPVQQRVLRVGANHVVQRWDGQAWATLPSANPPSTTGTSAYVTFDSTRGHMVMLLGSETWEWDGSAWTNIPSTVTPPARDYAKFVFDAQRGESVLVGGCIDRSTGFSTYCFHTRDEWVWNGTQWRSIALGSVGPMQGRDAASYDSLRGRVVIHGGRAWGDDTWGYSSTAIEWDGTQFRLLPSQNAPALGEHFMVYDRFHARMLVFGGTKLAPGLFGWDYNNALWFLSTTREAGSDCVDNASCRSGMCVDGVCCGVICGVPDDAGNAVDAGVGDDAHVDAGTREDVAADVPSGDDVPTDTMPMHDDAARDVLGTEPSPGHSSSGCSASAPARTSPRALLALSLAAAFLARRRARAVPSVRTGP